MFERFTDRSRAVIQLANQEAQRFNHEYVGTEHILLGLVKEGSGIAAHVLKNLDVDLRKIRLEVEKIVHSGPAMLTIGKLPYTPRARRVLEFAIKEANALSHNYVGTEHVLLGLLREQEGVASDVLRALGLSTEQVRGGVNAILGTGMAAESPEPGCRATKGEDQFQLTLCEKADVLAKRAVESLADELRRLGLDGFKINIRLEHRYQ